MKQVRSSSLLQQLVATYLPVVATVASWWWDYCKNLLETFQMDWWWTGCGCLFGTHIEVVVLCDGFDAYRRVPFEGGCQNR